MPKFLNIRTRAREGLQQVELGVGKVYNIVQYGGEKNVMSTIFFFFSFRIRYIFNEIDNFGYGVFPKNDSPSYLCKVG